MHEIRFLSPPDVCLVGLVFASANTEHEVPGSIPGSRDVLLGFSVKKSQ